MKKIVLLVLLVNTLFVSAQIGGSNTYEFLNVPVSARVGALGGSLIAVKDNDPTLTLTNPSLMNEDMSGMTTLSYLNYFADINHGYASYIKDFKKAGTYSLGLKYIDYGTFLETDEGGNELGNFSAGEYAFVVGWGKRIDSLFSVGANLKTIYSNLYTYNSVGVGLDFSATYYNKEKEFTVAAVIKNVGTQLKPYVKGTEKEPIPFEIQVGISKKLKYVPFRLSVDLIHLDKWNLSYNDSTISTNKNDLLSDEDKASRNKTSILSEAFRHIIIGGEFVPSKTFNVRFGFNYKRRSELALEDRAGLVGFSWGFGVRIKKIYLSYGSARYHLAGSSNHFTITTNLSEYYRKGNKQPKTAKKRKVKKEKDE